MRGVILSFFLMSSFLTFGQYSKDCVILRSRKKGVNQDTIFGRIVLPQKGRISTVNIQTEKGFRRYQTYETVGFKASDLYFGSFKYNGGYVFAPRIIEGKVELYFYYSGIGGKEIKNYYVFLSDDIKTGLILTVVTNAVQAIAASNTSCFYLFDRKTNMPLRVPRSMDRFAEEVAEVFKDDEDLYSRIKNAEFNPDRIAEIVQIYNKKSRDF